MAPKEQQSVVREMVADFSQGILLIAGAPTNASALDRIVADFLPIAVLVVFFFLPSVSRKIFQTW